jgi:hypothetical protein
MGWLPALTNMPFWTLVTWAWTDCSRTTSKNRSCAFLMIIGLRLGSRVKGLLCASTGNLKLFAKSIYLAFGLLEDFY